MPSEFMGVRVPELDAAQLREIARNRDTSLSALIRAGIQSVLSSAATRDRDEEVVSSLTP